MKNQLEMILQKITDKKGEGDLIYSSGKSLKISSQKGAVSEYKVSSSQMVGIRVIKDSKVGISFSEAMDEDSLNFMLHQAFENAQNNEANPHETILDLSGQLEDLSTENEEDVDIKLKIQKALELETEVMKADSRVVAVPYNGFSENEHSSIYLSTKGRMTVFSDKVYSITSSALMDENGKKASFYDYHIAHRFHDLHWEKVRENSLFNAKHLLSEKPLSTGKYQVYFSPNCLKSLIECFSNYFSAKAAIDKVNPWAMRLGEKVISEDLTFEDRPLFEKAFRVSKFDSEGVLRKDITLIKNGVLQSFYHNSVTAAKMKQMNTGHAHRGPSSSIEVSGTNLVIHGKNIKNKPNRYLEVIQMDGLHSGVNRVTGNFSFAVKGYIWDHEERISTVGGCTLSGNIMELLKNVEVVGDELISSTDQSFFSVPLIFNQLSIAGS